MREHAFAVGLFLSGRRFLLARLVWCGIGCRLEARDREELRPRRVLARAAVDVVDLVDRGAHRRAIGQQLGQRRLVRDQGTYLPRVPGGHGEPGDGTAAAAEHLRRIGCDGGVNRYAILYRIGSVKRPGTRARKIAQYVAMLAEHKTIYR